MTPFDPIHQSIQQLIEERDELKAQVEDLRCEALAWRGKAENAEPVETGTRITIETTEPGVGEWLEGLILAAKDRKAMACSHSDLYGLLITVESALRRYKILLRDGMRLAAEHNWDEATNKLALAIRKAGQAENAYANGED